MGLALVPALLSLALLQSSPADSAYADAATRALVERARVRHAAQDTLVHDYRARLTTRVDASLGTSRFARAFPFIASEQVAGIQWSAPNNLRVAILGRRSRTLLPGGQVEVGFDRPWFFPRSVGDSIRLFGEGLPERAALHPLAAGADAYYRFAITDSLTLRLPNRTIETATLDVRPRRTAPSLIAGAVTVDRTTGEVIRLTFLFLGEYLWVSAEDVGKDSAQAVRDNRIANQALRVEADIEYALYQERYWMPFRQLVTIWAHDRWITGAVIPVRMVSRFTDYEINTGHSVSFRLELPDTADVVVERDGDGEGRDSGRVARAGRSGDGGRWEMERPPLAELHRYGEWPDSLSLEAQPGDEQRLREMGEELARLAEGLPAEFTGRGGTGLVRWGEMLRFNRVQGLSVGGAVALDPRIPFTSVLARARLGLSDQRLLASVALRRDAPGGVVEVSLFRALRDVDPFSNGTSLANSVNALFAGHDDADYLLASGASATATARLGRWEWVGRVGVERHGSVAREAGSRINDFFFGDGVFPPNPPVREGWWSVGGMTLRRVGALGSITLGADGLGDRNLAGGRVWTELRVVTAPIRVSALAGAASRADLPQLLFRAGGPLTVRGFNFGTRAGQEMWAVQVEAALPRHRLVRPFVFADAGNADSPGALFRSSPLVGVGAGLSAFLLVSEFRLELSQGVGAAGGGRARLDLLFRPAR